MVRTRPIVPISWKGWTVSCEIIFLGLNGNPVKSESREFKCDPQNLLAPKWIENAI